MINVKFNWLSHLPHEIVVLEQVNMFRGQYSASEWAHLSPSFDPCLREDAKAFSRDGALCNDHLTGQHQTGQLLHLCKCKEVRKCE